MYPYFWRWIVFGAPACQAYVRKQPHNHGQSETGMQCYERWWGIFKRMMSGKGAKYALELALAAKFCDIYTMGAVAYDQIDPTTMGTNHIGNKFKIEYDPTGKNTKMIELIELMPDECQNIMDDLFKIRFGDVDSISERLTNPIRNDRNFDSACRLISKDLNTKYISEMLHDNEFLSGLEILNKKMTRNEIYAGLVARMHGTEEIDSLDSESGLQ